MAKETKAVKETEQATTEVGSDTKTVSGTDPVVEKLQKDLEFFQTRTGELEREIADLQRLLKDTKQGQKVTEKALEKAGVPKPSAGLPQTAVRGQRGVRSVRTVTH